jgi:hypothetical protein
MAESTGSAREEAERLVATVLAMAARSGMTRPGGLGETVAGLVDQFTGAAGGRSSGAAGDHAAADRTSGPGWHGPGGAWATGSAECCVCPVCRVIANLRDPSPHAMERLATGAGDFATGLASLMRGVSAMTGERHRTTRPRPAPPRPDPDAMWTAATRRGTAPPPAPEPDEHDSPWAAATRAAAADASASERPARPAPTTTPAPDQAAEVDGTAEPERSAEPAPATAPTPPPVPPGATSRRVGGDVWAAATADKTVTDVSPPRAVDHDDPGAAAGHGSAPAAVAAEDPDAGAGDDARTGGGV